MTAQHFISISGGKDSQAVMALAIERLADREFGNNPPRFLFADTGNEHQLTLDHVAYLDRTLRDRTGWRIETVSAYSVPGLIDAAAFARKRQVIRDEWSKERRRRMHRKGCDKKLGCGCPVQVSAPLPADLIDQAVRALRQTGVAFLDMAMLHGRFPGARTRFCTDELKLAPMRLIKQPVIDAGISVIEWIGERADESKARSRLPKFLRFRHPNGASQLLYRPLLHKTADEVFEISKAADLRPNPLYLKGMTRVGCMPCIMCKKGELRQIATRFPDAIDKLERWEAVVSQVARRGSATFFAAKMLPPDEHGDHRAAIRRAVEWSRTGYGGRQFDLISHAEEVAGEEDGWLCESAYGLCE